MSALLIKASASCVPVEPEDGKIFSLEELQRYVGGYIECVWLPANMVMVVNEEGLLYELPLNVDASFLAGQQIVGDVVFCYRSQLD